VIIMSSAGGNESLDFRFSRLGCMIRWFRCCISFLFPLPL
jgi:hypothetical protein